MTKDEKEPEESMPVTSQLHKQKQDTSILEESMILDSHIIIGTDSIIQKREKMNRQQWVCMTNEVSNKQYDKGAINEKSYITHINGKQSTGSKCWY